MAGRQTGRQADRQAARNSSTPDLYLNSSLRGLIQLLFSSAASYCSSQEAGTDKSIQLKLPAIFQKSSFCEANWALLCLFCLFVFVGRAMQNDKNHLIPESCIVSKSSKTETPFCPHASCVQYRGQSVWDLANGLALPLHTVAAYSLHIINCKMIHLQLIFELFFFFFFWSASVVAAGCSGGGGRAGGREGGCLSRALRPDLELDLFLFTLQPRREIFKSAMECVYMCVRQRERQREQLREEERKKERQTVKEVGEI